VLGLQRLERIFPALRTTVYSVVAEPDEKYNRIARAAGVVHDWWDPIDETRYWPPSTRRGDTVEIAMGGGCLPRGMNDAPTARLIPRWRRSCLMNTRASSRT